MSGPRIDATASRTKTVLQIVSKQAARKRFGGQFPPPYPNDERVDQGTRLRQEFVEREERALAKAALREHRNRLNGALGGGLAGFAAAISTAAVTRQAILWHSFVLEATLGACAGYLLARRGGGLLVGVALFVGSYVLAFQIRASGFDPSVLFAPGDLRVAMASQGHLMSIGVLITCGGLLGHIMED